MFQKPVAGKMPHMTWCLTGHLAFLPMCTCPWSLWREGPADNRLCRFVDALLDANAKRPPARHSGNPQLLAVSQPATPTQNFLPGTVREVYVIQAL